MQRRDILERPVGGDTELLTPDKPDRNRRILNAKTMQHCRKCGYRFDMEGRFCPRCGAESALYLDYDTVLINDTAWVDQKEEPELLYGETEDLLSALQNGNRQAAGVETDTEAVLPDWPDWNDMPYGRSLLDLCNSLSDFRNEVSELRKELCARIEAKDGTWDRSGIPQEEDTVWDCWFCGRSIRCGARICPYCGTITDYQNKRKFDELNESVSALYQQFSKLHKEISAEYEAEAISEGTLRLGEMNNDAQEERINDVFQPDKCLYLRDGPPIQRKKRSAMGFVSGLFKRRKTNKKNAKEVVVEKAIENELYCYVIHNRCIGFYFCDPEPQPSAVAFSGFFSGGTLQCTDVGQTLTITVTENNLILRIQGRYRNSDETIPYQKNEWASYRVPMYDAAESWEFYISDDQVDFEKLKPDLFRTSSGDGEGENPIYYSKKDIKTIKNRLGILVRMKTGETIEINRDGFLVGREKDKVDYCIPDIQTVARVHARFTVREGHTLIQDMESKNGTFVNGVRCAPNKEIVLKNGDKITLADEEFEFRE